MGCLEFYLIISKNEDEMPFHTAQQYIEEPSLQEVNEEISKLRNFKALGTENILGELFKQ